MCVSFYVPLAPPTTTLAFLATMASTAVSLGLLLLATRPPDSGVTAVRSFFFLPVGGSSTQREAAELLSSFPEKRRDSKMKTKKRR